jgi:hypothetical protein
MPSVFISDPRQPEKEPVEVRPDPLSGEFEAKGFIPGDALLASVGIGNLPPIPIPGIPIPPDNPEYETPVAPIPVVSDGINLKVSIRPVDESVDTTLLYANGLSMDFLLEVENIGTKDCTAATYEIEYYDPYLTVNDPSPNKRLGTLTPKDQGGSTYKKTIPLTITPKPLSGNLAFKDAEIRVRINDPIVQKTWNDSVSIRYNRAKIPFLFRSEYPVQGIIKVPGGKTHHFKTDGLSYGNYTYTIELPWSTEDYFVIFSGATAETEAAYSLGINTAPSGDFITFNDTGIYEPNDSEEHAVFIENKDSITAYLHGGSQTDIDYYRINIGNDAPVIKQVSLVSYSFRENGGNVDGPVNPGKSAYLDLLVKNVADENRSVTVNLSVAAADARYVTIEKGSASTPVIRPGYYASLTGSTDSQTGSAGLFTGSINQALRVYVSSDCPIGISIPFVLSFTDSLSKTSWTETISLGVSVLSGASLEKSLNWISGNAVGGGVYIITLKKDETIAPKTLSYNGKNVGIILAGGAFERIVSLSADGAMFTVGSGVTLTLGGNVTLRGRSSNTDSLVSVSYGGTLVMNTGSKITGNTTSHFGGGVDVDSGKFTMNGGEISGNTADYGGGVHIYGTYGTFTMNGGEISGNTASPGGGVYISDGTFTMSGGKISGNTASNWGGGGVYVGDGTFTMNGGEISGNTTASYGGGGVYVGDGAFTKSGNSTIYGSNASAALKNTAENDSYGHAVYVYVYSGSQDQKRNTTAGPGVTLDSRKEGSAGGWE